jgi:hypothetical protein
MGYVFSKPAKRGPPARGVSTRQYLPRPERGGGQVLFVEALGRAWRSGSGTSLLFCWSTAMKDALLAYVKRVKELHEKVKSEEATKLALIGPLFTLLGYDLADPEECVPQFKAEFGKDRSVKPVDWAFYQNGQPIFLVEAKDAGKHLDGYDEQLGDYFAKVRGVRLGILTNGVTWRFFTDIIDPNRMDEEPFVKWDVLSDEQPPYDFLTILKKSEFNAELVRAFAQNRRTHNLLVNELDKLLEPTAEFTRLAIANIEKKRPLTAAVLESWKLKVASAIREWAKQRTLASVLTRSPSQDGEDDPADPSGKDRPERYAASLLDIIGAKVIAVPCALFKVYKGKTMTATLLPDGKVEFEGVAYDTCSSAAEAARSTVTGQKMNTNGWTFWQITDKDGTNKTLDDIRQRFLETRGQLPKQG